MRLLSGTGFSFLPKELVCCHAPVNGDLVVFLHLDPVNQLRDHHVFRFVAGVRKAAGPGQHPVSSFTSLIQHSSGVSFSSIPPPGTNHQPDLVSCERSIFPLHMMTARLPERVLVKVSKRFAPRISVSCILLPFYLTEERTQSSSASDGF